MYGFPRVLKTRQDYERCHGNASYGKGQRGNPQDGWPGRSRNRYRYMFGGKKMPEAWQALLAGRFVYVFDRTLAADEKPDGPEPDYRVVEDEELGRRQYKLVEDKSAKIYKLGFSTDEIETKIAELEAK